MTDTSQQSTTDGTLGKCGFCGRRLQLDKRPSVGDHIFPDHHAWNDRTGRFSTDTCRGSGMPATPADLIARRAPVAAGTQQTEEVSMTDQRKVGDYVYYDGDKHDDSIGLIVKDDLANTADDENWFIEFPDGQYAWSDDEDCELVTERQVQDELAAANITMPYADKVLAWLKSRDALTPAEVGEGDPTKSWIQVGTPLKTAESLEHGVRTGVATLGDVQRLSTYLFQQLDRQQGGQVAKGACSQCMGDVTFSGQTGAWEHDQPGNSHTPPAVIPVS